jgi:hypothetical protein
MTQWHPIFDDLLRRTLQDYYEVQTNVPVGDLPREADIVLVLRASSKKPPFRTLWKHLTRWNILEFKGRSESARVGDVDLLVQVGLGVHRRLQEQDPKTKIDRAEVSFWYLANHLGKRFLERVIELTGKLESTGPGLWRGQVLGRTLWLVSNNEVVIDVESAPVSVLSEQSAERALQLARVVVASDELWQTNSPLLGASFPALFQEFEDMATKRGRKKLDFGDMVRNIITVASPEELDRSGVTEQILEKVGVDRIFAALKPEQLRELLKRAASAKK